MRIVCLFLGILAMGVEAVMILRTVIMYTALIFGVRLLGKRQIGQLEPAELVVTMLVAELATLPMQDPEATLGDGLIPMTTVLVLEILLALGCLRSVGLRRLLCGKPVIIIENGRIIQENLRKNRITLDELSGHLRSKDILDISQVQFAILETDGSLSVFPFPATQPASAKDAGIQVERQRLPVTIVGDGYLYRENLKVAGKDMDWVRRVLMQRGTDIVGTYLLTVDKGDRIVFIPKE